MDLAISAEDRVILEGLRTFNDRESVRLEHEHSALFDDARQMYEPTGRYVREILELQRRVRVASAAAGFYALLVPMQLGGGARDSVMTFHVWETLYATYGYEYHLPFESIAHWATGPGPLLLGLNESVRSKILPDLLSGEKTVCFGMSEPDAGSDPWMMKMRAVRDGDGWVINGSKQWITNAPYADYAAVFAVTDPEAFAARKGGVSCFLVDAKVDGYAVDGVIRLFGDLGSPHGILSFADVRTPDDHLIGDPGKGLQLALEIVSHGRLYNCARAVGAAQWALRKAVQYGKERESFGRRIADNQGVSFMLADSATEIYAAKYMSLHLAWLIGQGNKAIKEMAMAKAFATEMCFRVFDRAMQVFGAMGLTNEVHLYRGWQNARSLRIADGTSEILRRTVGDRLLKGDLSF